MTDWSSSGFEVRLDGQQRGRWFPDTTEGYRSACDYAALAVRDGEFQQSLVLRIVTDGAGRAIVSEVVHQYV
jgi:hypothetical protein